MAGATGARRPFGFASVALYYTGMDTVTKKTVGGRRPDACSIHPATEAARGEDAAMPSDSRPAPTPRSLRQES